MNKLIKNYLYTIVYQLLLIITPFITTPYVARVLKPEGIGIDAYVLSIVQLFLVFAILSIPMYGSRQIGAFREKAEATKQFWSIYSVQLIFSLIIVTSFVLYGLSVSEYKMLFFIHILSLVSATIDISWYFIGKEQVKSITIRNVIVRLVSIALIFTLVNDVDDLPIYIAINAGTLFLGQLVMWIPLVKEISFEKPSLQDVKGHIKPIISLFIPQIMIYTYVLVNKIVLGRVSGEVEVGFYNQADKVVRIALGVITSLGTVLLPRMAYEFTQGNKESMTKYINYALQFVLLITLPMTLGLIGIAPNFIEWFLGDEFHSVVQLLMLMSPVIFFVGLANVFGVQILVSTNQQNKYTIAVTIGAIFSMIANTIFVGLLAGTATTIALLIAEGVGALIQMYFARKYFSFTHFIKLFLKYLILSFIIFIAVISTDYLLNINEVIVTAVQLILAGVIYLVGLLIIKDSIVMLMMDKVKSRRNRMPG